jgi:hypothetical protein
MILIINNHDYTAVLDAAHPLTIERTLNAPSVCQLTLALPQDGFLAAPARFQSVSISGDDGTIYFTGYIAATPLPLYAGLAIDGPRYRILIRAVSDEIFLDQALSSSSKAASGLTAGALMSNLATHTGSAALDVSALTLNAPVSHFTPAPGAPFSKSAGEIATRVRATYRAQAGALALNSIPSSVHPLSETDDTVTLANLTLSHDPHRDLANDITVCGEHEPAAYVTEIFQGDGATSSFYLSADPYFPPSSKTTLISELFNSPAIDETVWSGSGGSTYLSLGPGGMVINGGGGVDGQTQLAWLDPVEMAGTLLLEAEGVTLANASTGLLAAFFSGGQDGSSCFAGFQATAQQGTGTVVVQPFLLGSPTGATSVINPARQYTLRIRIHAAEQQRARATYLSFGDNGLINTGGQFVASTATVQFEIQEFVNGVASMPLTLYEGLLSNSPAACTVVAASSLNLHGSIRAIHLTSLGSAWVVSTPQNGAPFTRRLGTAAQSAECRVDRSGRLVFDIGFMPAVGEQIAVTYRAIAPSVGRAVNAASQQALAAQGSPATSSWIGSVTNPPARSSADCRHAAAALAESASSAAALWSGTYRGTNFEFASDVWPGDALAFNVPSCNLTAQVVVRTVKLIYGATVPDLFAYEIAFANDWAQDLAIHTSQSVPADAWLPAPPTPTYAPNLDALTVTSISGNTVTVNTGATAPPGGGFEIRNRDYTFMPGQDPSLVMRGSQPNLTFTRTSAADRFYIRMFDGADPPNYSEFSAALFLHLPLSS